MRTTLFGSSCTVRISVSTPIKIVLRKMTREHQMSKALDFAKRVKLRQRAERPARPAGRSSRSSLPKFTDAESSPLPTKREPLSMNSWLKRLCPRSGLAPWVLDLEYAAFATLCKALLAETTLVRHISNALHKPSEPSALPLANDNLRGVESSRRLGSDGGGGDCCEDLGLGPLLPKWREARGLRQLRLPRVGRAAESRRK
mmetsp:Transcript_18566/g.52821  ORF Transcript_18566/g.52821 Transcript_18566/m.52821 type:complete len:201 (-) Transcript_18566:164-766(-)